MGRPPRGRGPEQECRPLSSLDLREREAEDSPPNREPLAGQKAKTHRRILAAARGIFLRSGFTDANLNEVARAAGVGKGTLYRHFENKGELYVATLSEHGSAFLREMTEALDPRAPALEQIAQVGRFYLGFWERHPEHFQLIWAVQNRHVVGDLSPELMGHVRQVFERPLRLLEALIRAGIEQGTIRPVDPWNSANALALSANAVVGPIVTRARPVVKRDMHDVYRQLLDLFLAGLAAATEADSTPR